METGIPGETALPVNTVPCSSTCPAASRSTDYVPLSFLIAEPERTQLGVGKVESPLLSTAESSTSSVIRMPVYKSFVMNMQTRGLAEEKNMKIKSHSYTCV